ncbi:MAG: response regulator [Candidatus Nealsonbacteria bacterium]|nr:response regulator [Candidatus Nealsonbacteria bacterium]
MDNQVKRILIIDDEEAVQKILISKLSGAGFEPLSAMDGKEGLKATKKERPDLILLDIVMPVMDGISYLKELKKDPEVKDIPILILTNLASDEMVQKSLEQGVTDYLVKADYTLDELVEKINEKLNL